MSLNKNKIKGFAFRFWWHLDSIEAQNASYDILSLFYNSVKEQYPERRTKTPSNSVGELEMSSKDNKDLKLTIKNDELDIHIGDVSEFNDIYLKSLISENRNKIIDIFHEIDVTHDHFHQDIVSLYFYKFSDSNLISNLKEIGVHLDVKIGTSEKEIENINLSFSFSNDDLGRIDYQIVKGTYKEEMGLLIQTHYVSPKIPTSKDALDEWINQIISSIN